jgi:hypothetical protein
MVKGQCDFPHEKEAFLKPSRGRIQRFYEEVQKGEDETADHRTRRLSIREADNKIGQRPKKENDLACLYDLRPDF